MSLLLGVHSERAASGAAAGRAHARDVALVGVAGMLAGAASMACGEWISMRTQAEALEGQLAVERGHLLAYPASEAAEFAAFLQSRGVRRRVAEAVVSDIGASEDALSKQLDIHAVRDVRNAIRSVLRP